MSLTQETKGLFSQIYNRVEGLRAGKPGVGNVFWVDNVNGSDTLWNGRRPTTGQHKGGPFATITHALTQCTNYADDYILVLRGGGETYPIAVAVDRVHIIGITNPGTPQTVSGYLSGAAVCITINASHVEIAGLMLLADATHPAIDILGQCWGLWVHHCSFGTTAAALHGIRADVEGPVGGLIEDCIFGTSIAEDGIRAISPTRSLVRNNIFQGYGLIGVHFTGTGPNMMQGIIHNFFYQPVGGVLGLGWAIHLSGLGGSGGIVAHNFACASADKATGAPNNPYRDSSSLALDTSLHGWAGNYWGEALTPPDVT